MCWAISLELLSSGHFTLPLWGAATHAPIFVRDRSISSLPFFYIFYLSLQAHVRGGTDTIVTAVVLGQSLQKQWPEKGSFFESARTEGN